MNALDATTPGALADDESTRFDWLFRTHYGRVTRVIGRIVGDRARAEELAADVFVKWQRTPSAHGDGAEGWLYRVAAREALDAWRRQARWGRVQQVLAHVRLASRTPEDVHADERQRDEVRATLAALKPREATALLLWSEDVSYAGIATAVGVQPASVGTLVRRAQESFRKEFETRYGTPS
ncbi:MAG TPA: sigma-70 family RNA polymerase sigma factor [Luteitalea sp.]|nr:sigma-70 family RNA polymerase sigma factor [Luteitalea sp.]